MRPGPPIQAGDSTTLVTGQPLASPASSCWGWASLWLTSTGTTSPTPASWWSASHTPAGCWPGSPGGPGAGQSLQPLCSQQRDQQQPGEPQQQQQEWPHRGQQPGDSQDLYSLIRPGPPPQGGHPPPQEGAQCAGQWGDGAGGRVWTSGAPPTVWDSTVLEGCAPADSDQSGGMRGTPLHQQLITFGTLHPSDSSSSSPNFYHWEDHYMRNGVLMPTWALRIPESWSHKSSPAPEILIMEWWHQSQRAEWVVPERAVGKWWQWFKCPRLWLTAARQPRSLHHSDGRRQPHNNQQSDVEAIRASLHWTHPTCSFFLRTFIIECKLPNLIYVSLNTIPWL